MILSATRVSQSFFRNFEDFYGYFMKTQRPLKNENKIYGDVNYNTCIRFLIFNFHQYTKYIKINLFYSTTSNEGINFPTTSLLQSLDLHNVFPSKFIFVKPGIFAIACKSANVRISKEG